MVYMIHTKLSSGAYAHTVEAVFETRAAAELWIKRQDASAGGYSIVNVPLWTAHDVEELFHA